MRNEPLFIKFLNSQVGVSDIVHTVLTSSVDEVSKDIAKNTLDGKLPDLSQFRKDFSEAIDDIIDNGLSQRFINYVNSYMKPSLIENVKGSDGGRAGEERHLMIKDSEAPWVEAVVCYNLCIYIKAYGQAELKRCPVCRKFFSNKGKYAKYCSESCKRTAQ